MLVFARVHGSAHLVRRSEQRLFDTHLSSLSGAGSPVGCIFQQSYQTKTAWNQFSCVGRTRLGSEIFSVLNLIYSRSLAIIARCFPYTIELSDVITCEADPLMTPLKREGGAEGTIGFSRYSWALLPPEGTTEKRSSEKRSSVCLFSSQIFFLSGKEPSLKYRPAGVVVSGKGIIGAYHYQKMEPNMAQKNNTSLERKVRDAIRKLTDDGKQITNQTVRDAIDGGSFRDIGPLVKQIKAEIVAKEQADRAAPEMPEDFRDAAAAMWQTSWQLADEIATSERHAHAQELERLRSEAEEALSNCGLVEDERDEAEKRGEALATKLVETEAALLDTKFEIAKLNGQLAEREAFIESKLVGLRAIDSAEASTGEENAQATESQSAITSKAKTDHTQLDMFSKTKADKKNPSGPEPIAAE